MNKGYDMQMSVLEERNITTAIHRRRVAKISQPCVFPGLVNVDKKSNERYLKDF